MRGPLLLLFLLSVLALAGAWPVGNTIPSCVGGYTLTFSGVSANFVITNAGALYACQATNDGYWGLLADVPLNADRGARLTEGGTGQWSLSSNTGSGNNNINLTMYACADNSTHNLNCVANSGNCNISSDDGSQSFTIGNSAKANYTNLGNGSINITPAATSTGSFLISATHRFIARSSTTSTTNGGISGIDTCNISNSSFIEYSVGGNRSLLTPFNNGSTSTAQDIYLSFDDVRLMILRSDFNGNTSIIPGNWSNTSSTLQASLYYQTQAIQPLITYSPGVNAFLNWFNGSSGTAYLYNNTPTYVLDNTTKQWYLVPAVQATNLSNVLTINVVLVPGGQASNNSLPLIPNFLSCRQSGDQYVINASFPVATVNLATYQNSTNVNTTSNTSSSFYLSVNTTTYPSVSFSANGTTYCERANSSTLLPIPSMNLTGQGAAKYVAQIILVASMGVGVFQPFALIFTAGFNDMFTLVDPASMAVLLTIAVVLSAILNGFDRVSTVKSILVYSVLIISVLVQLYPLAGYSTTPLTNATASLAALTTNDGTFKFWDFLSNSFSLIIYLLLFLLTLPVLAVNAFTVPVCSASPAFCTPVNAVGAMVVLGFYCWVILKGYEVITNKFRDV